MQFNWIDLLFIVFVIYSLIDGWQRGFIALISHLVSLVGATWVAAQYHDAAGDFIGTTFGIAPMWRGMLGYLVVAFFAQIVIDVFCSLLIRFVPQKFLVQKINNALGSLTAVSIVVVIAAFMVLLLLELPLRGTIKTDIQNSFISKQLIHLAETYGGPAGASIANTARNITKFLTIEPGSQESLTLQLPEGLTNLPVDVRDEVEMVKLVNSERASRGIAPLTVDAKMTKVAEAKSRDMFARRYFSHYDPDGKTVVDHFTAAGISFQLAGENLAFAPDLATAHKGLMDSPGHKANILDVQFHRIGIGVIDGGIYGKLYTQEFAD
jgi:uncharacterized protein YkwD/uncharacterized membrane protein required for colicin V production